MYFTRKFHPYATIIPSHRRYVLYAECSRGFVELSKERQTPCDPKYKTSVWRWSVGIRKTPSFTKLKKDWSNREPLICRAGYTDTVMNAARKGLQHLFSQRKQPVYKLLELLVKDQPLYELATVLN